MEDIMAEAAPENVPDPMEDQSNPDIGTESNEVAVAEQQSGKEGEDALTSLNNFLDESLNADDTTKESQAPPVENNDENSSNALSSEPALTSGQQGIVDLGLRLRPTDYGGVLSPGSSNSTGVTKPKVRPGPKSKTRIGIEEEEDEVYDWELEEEYNVDDNDYDPSFGEEKPKKRRGRPPKSDTQKQDKIQQYQNVPKRGRGRPKKSSVNLSLPLHLTSSQHSDSYSNRDGDFDEDYSQELITSDAQGGEDGGGAVKTRKPHGSRWNSYPTRRSERAVKPTSTFDGDDMDTEYYPPANYKPTSLTKAGIPRKPYTFKRRIPAPTNADAIIAHGHPDIVTRGQAKKNNKYVKVHLREPRANQYSPVNHRVSSANKDARKAINQFHVEKYDEEKLVASLMGLLPEERDMKLFDMIKKRHSQMAQLKDTYEAFVAKLQMDLADANRRLEEMEVVAEKKKTKSRSSQTWDEELAVSEFICGVRGPRSSSSKKIRLQNIPSRSVIPPQPEKPRELLPIDQDPLFADEVGDLSTSVRVQPALTWPSSSSKTFTSTPAPVRAKKLTTTVTLCSDSESEDAPPRKKGGRPKGSKDSYKRTRTDSSAAKNGSAEMPSDDQQSLTADIPVVPMSSSS